MSAEEQQSGLYALVAEFDDPELLVSAAERTTAEGYTATDAHVPFPIHGLSHALAIRRTILPWLVLAAGILGCLGGFFMQYWISVIDYPLNIGGRPFNSWPSFVPVTFECTILLSALCVIIGMLSLNGLPLPHHPIFNTPNFDRASENGFFLCIEAKDPKFDLEAARQFLQSLGPRAVHEVEF